MMAYYETDVLVVPVLLFEVRPAKQEYEGDVYDEGGGCERERELGTRVLLGSTCSRRLPSSIWESNVIHRRRWAWWEMSERALMPTSR